MIECPNCKAEIDDDSLYCDQCGSALSFCTKCGRVGVGKCCSSCGAPMTLAAQAHNTGGSVVSQHTGGMASQRTGASVSVATATSTVAGGVPMGGKMPPLALGNVALGINIVGVDDAVIGRREGPYMTLFQNNRYVSGRHAQLHYTQLKGWVVVDKKSSNGTFVNKVRLVPETPMPLTDGDTLTIANVSLKVKIG